MATLGLPEPPTLSLFLTSFNRDNLYYEVRFDNCDRNSYEKRYQNFLEFLKGVYKSQRKRLLQAETIGANAKAKQLSMATTNIPSFTSAAKAPSGTTSSSSSSPQPPPTPLLFVANQVDPVCGIIYCGQRQTCEEVANRLVRDGIQAAAFHSGMTPKQRADVQGRWCGQGIQVSATKTKTGTDEARKPDQQHQQQIDVIVATIAFGMGIDKPNVRFVCHWELPKTIEGTHVPRQSNQEPPLRPPITNLAYTT